MLFNSLIFLIFLAIFLIGWPWMKQANQRRWVYLTIASFIFYGWWDWRFLFLMVGVGLVNYYGGRGIVALPRWRKAFLAMSVIGTLTPLIIFKYLDFGIVNINAVLGMAGVNGALSLHHLILPVGISFFTFQAMNYTIGVYQGKCQPAQNVFHYFAFKAIFPLLMAGPIVRANDLLPQLMVIPRTTEDDRWEGFRLIVYGYFKKVVVADTIAPAVAAAFTAKTFVDSSGYWWVMMVLFSYQIYCDFSGYSDIARGLGKWMGYDFMVNFNHPYISASFREFWTRWHISLSSWFRDYVYIPLGGSRQGTWASHRNMWITMLLSGLWHGASWAFIIWAALHAFYLSLERVTRWPERMSQIPIVGKCLTVLTVFVMTMIAWIFFRVGSLGALTNTQQMALGWDILASMFSFHNFTNFMGNKIDNNAINVSLIMIGRQLFFLFGLDQRSWLAPRMARVVEPVIMAILILMCVFLRGPGNAFIYFQF